MTRWHAGWLCAVVAFFVGHAYYYAFLQDDAYVFLRYADNFVNGHGLVWNVGERVEGYSSFLWLVWLAGLKSVFGDALLPIHVTTIALGVVSILSVFVLSARLASNILAGVVGAGLLASDRTFAIWSTSGMDTRAYGTLVILLYVLFDRLVHSERSTHGNGIGLGLVLGLLALVRPEGLLFCGLALAHLAVVSRSGMARQGLRSALFTASSIFGLAVGTHLLWRHTYYGDLLPNTFYAKIPGLALSYGVLYILDYLHSYSFLVGCFIASAVTARVLLGPSPTIRHITLSVACYLAYVVAAGGDFMEYRFLDVTLPGLYAILGACMSRVLALASQSELRSPRPSPTDVSALLYSPTRAVILCFAVLPVSNLVLGLTFEAIPRHVVVRGDLAEGTTEYWVSIGKWLKDVAEPDEAVATTAAGAIPYYSELPAIDMLGLNDTVIARSGSVVNDLPGHRRRAPTGYLQSKGAAFVLGHPRLRMSTEQLSHVEADDGDIVVEIDRDKYGDSSGYIYLTFGTARNPRDFAQELAARGVRVLAPQ